MTVAPPNSIGISNSYKMAYSSYGALPLYQQAQFRTTCTKANNASLIMEHFDLKAITALNT